MDSDEWYRSCSTSGATAAAQRLCSSCRMLSKQLAILVWGKGAVRPSRREISAPYFKLRPGGQGLLARAQAGVGGRRVEMGVEPCIGILGSLGAQGRPAPDL